MPEPSESTASLIEDLLVEVLDHAPAERSAHLDELCRRHPDLAPELRGGFERLRDHGLLARVDAGEEPPERLGDFRLVERLGAGGMGVVYLAEQVSLGRPVALKIVRSEQLYFPRARERFQREVEAVARLSHRSIVPVYTVGEEGGIPYFAMKLVEGISLSRAIRLVQDSAPATLRGSDLQRLAEEAAGRASDPSGEASAPLFSGSWTETCLRIAREVAEALAHSHERDILHRDVKPSNVMVTPEGAVQLLDFGLASSSRDRTSITRSGGQLGSLPYMAPEQVEGRHGEVGERTDVYNLGATLYEMLALRRAFPQDTDAQLARAIVTTPPPALRKVFPDLPADVEIVCLKALEPEPERRYATAADFARDLANLLELRPIEARRASRLVRSKRWAQRNPGWAAASVLGALLVVGGPAGFGVQQHFAKERVQGALESATRERARADANFARALQALDLLTDIGENRLADVPQAEQARREILEEALAFYQSFLAQEGASPVLRRAVAQALMRKGVIHFALGNFDEATGALEEARERLQDLANELGPEAVEYEYGRTLGTLGQLEYLRGEGEAAEADLRRAALHLTAYYAPTEDDAALGSGARQIADIEGRLSQVLLTRGKVDEAVARLGDLAARVGTALAAREDEGLRRAHGELLWRLGEAQLEQGSREAAEESFLGALDALEPLLDDRPDFGVREIVGRVRLGLGKQASDAGRQEDAIAHYEAGLEVAKPLARDFPNIVATQSLLADLLANAATAHSLARRLDESIALYERAIPTYEKLLELQPEALHYRGRLGSLRGNVATSRFLRREWAQAEALYTAGIADLRAAVEAGAVDPDQRVQLPRMQLNLAWCLVNEGRHAEVLPLLEEIPMPDEEGARKPLFAAYLAGACISLAENDETLTPDARADAAATYIDRALEYVERSLAASTDRQGLIDVFAMDRYDPLRDLPRFQELMAELDARTD